MKTPLKLKLNSPSFPIPSIPLLIPKPNSPAAHGLGFGLGFGGPLPLMRDLGPLRLNRSKFIQHLPFSLSQIKSVNLSPPSMAEKAEKRENPPQTQPEKERQPPTPPEKPEAGDCCGSGCVRCVWDVYYDELEAYNKELQQFNAQTRPPYPQG